MRARRAGLCLIAEFASYHCGIRPDTSVFERHNMRGTVKFFNDEKGFGFIERDGGDDVFVHFSNIVGENHRTLEAEQEVEFDIGPGRKGDEAQNVKPV